MSGVEERKADRLRVMNEIYAEVGDNTVERVNLQAIRERLGLSDQKMGTIVNYLEGELLIKLRRALGDEMTARTASITHVGVKEMERSEEHPEQPTDHFPPQAGIIINVRGDMIGSAIQSNSAGATLHVDTGDIMIGTEADEQIRRFLDEFDAKLSALQPEQTAGALAEIAADVATVRGQLNSPKPKKNFIKESLASIRAVLENGMGGVVTSGLLALLTGIHM